MPLHVKSISIRVAVICFFCIALIGWLSGLSPFTCCKRAIAGAALIYIITTCAVKIINSILINAMVKNQLDQQKEITSDSGD